MFRKRLQLRRRGVLGAWICWGILLVPPFAALAADTWLNAETLRKDYEIGDINGRLKVLAEALDELHVKEARLEAMDRMEIEAPDLGLVEPQPDQIEVIYTDDRDALREEPTPFILAGTAGAPNPSGRLTGLAGENEDTLWNSDPHSTMANISPMEDLLKRVIRSACASYLGDS